MHCCAVFDEDGMNEICRKYMEGLLNVEIAWNGEVASSMLCSSVVLLHKKRLQQLSKG